MRGLISEAGAGLTPGLFRYLNESSVLHTLRQRYVNNLIQTYAGPSMITINPCKNLDVYSDKIRQMFKVRERQQSNREERTDLNYFRSAESRIFPHISTLLARLPTRT